MRVNLLLVLSILFACAGCQRKVVAAVAEESAPPTTTTTTTTVAVEPPADSALPATTITTVAYQPFPSGMKLTGQPLPATVNSCETVGEVWDFAGLDGCQLLLQTTEGYLFAVAGLPQGYELEGGTRIRFGFRYAEDTAAGCGRADGVVRITCMQLLRGSSGFPRPFVCEAFNEATAWIDDLIVDLRANYVTRFPWKDDRYVYLFETSDGQYLYDCRGFLLCQPKTNCLRFIEDFSLGKLIYEG